MNALRLTTRLPTAANKRALLRVSAPSRVLSSMDSETYTERMKKTGRPVSPHITVYAFPVVAISSVMVRITGGMLSVGLGGVAGVALIGGVDAPSVIMASLAASGVAPVAKFAVGYPLIYHFCGGVRHAVWDHMPETLQNASVEQASWVLFATSSVLSLGAAFGSL